MPQPRERLPVLLTNLKYLLAKNIAYGYSSMPTLTFLKSTWEIAMTAGTEHTHHLRLKETQMNLDADSRSRAENEDFEGQLRDAQQQLEVLQHQREQLERQKCEMDELNQRKEEFLDGQIELTERLSGSVTTIDRELFELRQELEDLEQTRQSFAAHLIRIEKVEPEGWQRESFTTELSRATCMLEQAEEEFHSAVTHFAGGRTRGIFGNPASGTKLGSGAGSGFGANFRSGLAYNLPLLVLGTVALLILLYK